MACSNNLSPQQRDELCASIIKSGIEVTQKYMQEHRIEDNTISRTASSTRPLIRNQAFALRQKLFGQYTHVPHTNTKMENSDSRAASITPPTPTGRSRNELYELRKILFGSSNV